MDEYKNTLKGMGIQFFAEKGEDNPGQDQDQNTQNQNNDQNAQDQDKGTGSQSGKTFTQDDVNRLLKAEKESAKKALLKELGVEDAKTAKEGLAKYKEIVDKDKTDAQKANEALGTETKAKEEAERRAQLAEAKVAVLTEGCLPEYLEDVITLALTRVSDDKDLAAVVKEMKADKKYAAFFGDGSDPNDKGTGGGSGYRRQQDKNDKVGSLGERLGKQAGTVTKNPYFNN